MRETSQDPESDFVVKRFRMGTLEVEGPLKTVDSRGLTRSLLEKEKGDLKNIVIETSKTIKDTSVSRLLRETDDSKIKTRFGFRNWFSNYPNVLTFTFDFSPYKVYGKLDNISGFFDYYHSYSDTAVFVPNVKVEKHVYTHIDGKAKHVRTDKRMNFEDYGKYVDEAFEILDFRNKKPIFVPIPLELGMDGIKHLANRYIKKGYSCFWADFHSSAATDRAKLSLIRHFKRILRDNERLDEMVMHTTNVRREITMHSRDDWTPSSDVLTSVIGSDLVGANREPPAPFAGEGPGLTPERKHELWEHKARVLEPDTYYYAKVAESDYGSQDVAKLMNKGYNVLFNSQLLNREFENQKKSFFDEATVKPYISGKRMVREYRNGVLAGVLFGKARTITDFF